MFHSAEVKDGSRNGKASRKDQHFPNFNRKLSSSSSTLLSKDISQGDSAVSPADVAVSEPLGAPGPKGGRAKSPVPGGCRQHRCPNKARSPKQHLARDPAVGLTRALCGVKAEEDGDAGGFGEGQSTLSGGTFSQSNLEMKSLEGNWGTGTPAPCFSSSDVSALCSDTPDSHPTAVLQDSEISHLIDSVTLTNEDEPDSSISALIGRFGETDDQANLTVVSPLRSPSVRSGHPPLPATDLRMPSKHGLSKGKPKSPSLRSSPEPIAFSSPETSARSARTVVRGATCMPAVSTTKPDGDLSGQAQAGAMESNLLFSSHPSHCWLPGSPINGQDWGTPRKLSPASSTDLTLGDVIADPTLGLHSGDSSLVELDGDSENLSATTSDYRREDTSPLASPLKLKYSQDTMDPFQRGLRNGYCKETLRPSVSAMLNSIQDGKQQSISCLAYQGAGFLHKHFSKSDAKVNQTCLPPASAPDLHAVPKPSPPPPLPALKLPSPCKSKSLGDLTSEDIACNFESKYQCISKSFVTTGVRDRTSVTVKAESLGPMDALTEQLRKLVSLEQEDGQVLHAQQDARQFPRALVRKLSSRSQSRVRNIASRAKEKQEASRQRAANPSSVGAVILRSRASGPAPAVNRHSTGSYIAGYLRGAPGQGAEARGTPEGACSALPAGHADQLCSDHSVLQTEPSCDDKPEIYFLLRL